MLATEVMDKIIGEMPGPGLKQRKVMSNNLMQSVTEVSPVRNRAPIIK
jgi:hypothetical protein